LQRPVISVGNLAVGGTGKTPVVAQLARVLIALGQRPAILSRGYGRAQSVDGVVIVSDGERLLADVSRSGDEPMMLARSVPGAGVFVCGERYLAGRLAEQRFGATVHLLDDGFQHVQLERTLDMVIVRREDAERGRPFPSGRLRETIDTAGRAHALIVPDATEEEAAAIADRFGVPSVFRTVSALGSPLRLDTFAAASPLGAAAPALAVAGIAEPQRFFDDLQRAGWTIAKTLRFRDHHPFTRSDVDAMIGAAREAGAEIIVTTEKDTMRLLPFRPFAMPLAWVPLTVSIEPAGKLREWLVDTIK
jgi:tetraacyldisaccharide 4'-kinase